MDQPNYSRLSGDQDWTLLWETGEVRRVMDHLTARAINLQCSAEDRYEAAAQLHGMREVKKIVETMAEQSDRAETEKAQAIELQMRPKRRWADYVLVPPQRARR